MLTLLLRPTLVETLTGKRRIRGRDEQALPVRVGRGSGEAKL
ncbi:MAG: hypothetical protein RMI91_08485 [Gemmatales bacterium]|nr:hypothetical protein [Gemmatales bacterium]MDW7994677.1 hypothetical protein [Gemmatales bacterium]